MAKKLGMVVALGLTSLLVMVGLAGCGNSVALTKDESLKTEWGTVLQYKIGDDWETLPGYSIKTSVTTSYYDEATESSLGIDLEDTNSAVYEYDTTSTYSDWLQSKEEFYTKSAQDQADWYKENITGDSYEEEYAQPENYADYTDFSIEEIGSEEVAGVEFRLYEMKYTSTYSDAWMEKIGEKNPDFDQVNHAVTYYAIVKDGEHDLEISANSEALLKSFLKTLTIKW